MPKRVMRRPVPMSTPGSSLAFNCCDQIQASWLDRARKCGDLIAHVARQLSSRVKVADLGCGDMKLRSVLLEQGTPFDYCAFDLLPQSPDVKQLDLEHDDIPSQYDVVVLLGVIEYLRRPEHVLGRLTRCTPWLVVSHVVRDAHEYSASEVLARGWMNHLTTSEFDALLKNAGWEPRDIVTTDDGRTRLWLAGVSQ